MHIRIVFANGAPGVDRARVVAWVKRSAKAVSAYFGRYPVSHHGLLVIAMPGDRIGHATTYGYAGSITRIHVGTSAGDAAFLNDWVLVHEMMHAALPGFAAPRPLAAGRQCNLSRTDCQGCGWPDT